jgi:hypothetical protein
MIALVRSLEVLAWGAVAIAAFIVLACLMFVGAVITFDVVSGAGC